MRHPPSLRRPVDRQGQQVERDSEQVEEGDGDEGRVRVEHVALPMEYVQFVELLPMEGTQKSDKLIFKFSHFLIVMKIKT